MRFSERLQSLVAMSTSFLDLIPGYLMILAKDLIRGTPLLIVYPQVLSFRGALLGIFTGRFTTSLHTGEMKPVLRNNSREFYSLLAVVLALSLIGSALISASSIVYLRTIHGLVSTDLWGLVSVIFSLVLISLITLIPLNVFVGSISFKKGLDPDIIIYPIVSSLADNLVTVLFIALTMLFTIGLATNLFSAIIMLTSILILKLYRLMNREMFLREFRESLMAILIIVLIVGLSGNILKAMEESIDKYPFVIAIYPSLMTLAGDFSSVVGSTLSTELHVSGLQSKYLRIYSTYILRFIPSSTIIITGLSIYSFILSNFNMFSIIYTFLTGLLTMLAMGVFSISVAIYTFVRGLDPDHFVIPVSTVVADVTTTVFLFTMYLLMLPP